MKICDFVAPELEQIRANANFTNDELELFNLRAEDIPLEVCAERMNLSISAIKRKSQKVNNKIKRIL